MSLRTEAQQRINVFEKELKKLNTQLVETKALVNTLTIEIIRVNSKREELKDLLKIEDK